MNRYNAALWINSALLGIFATTSFAQSTVTAPAQAAPERVILSDDFQRDESTSDKEEVGNGWSTNSKLRAKGKKQVDLDNGTLHVTMAEDAEHPVSVQQKLVYRDVRIEMRFKLAEDSEFKIDFADLKSDEVSSGHLGVVRISSSELILLDSKSGKSNMGYKRLRKEGKITDEILKIIASMKKTFDHATKVGVWHDLVVTLKGPALSVSIDEKLIGKFKSDGFAHPTKSHLRLGFVKEAWIDDIKVTDISEPTK